MIHASTILVCLFASVSLCAAKTPAISPVYIVRAEMLMFRTDVQAMEPFWLHSQQLKENFKIDAFVQFARPIAIPTEIPTELRIPFAKELVVNSPEIKKAFESSLYAFEEYSPKSVSGKVKERLSSQAIIFALFTKGDDTTWLIQESAQYFESKPLFILKEDEFDFKPGLFGDLEHIPFSRDCFERSYVPILEGLRELAILIF